MRFDSRILAAAVALTMACTVAARAADEKAPADKAKEKGNPMVILTTTMGDIKVELYPDKAPVTVENFRRYAGEHFYDGLIFHRVIANFMNQGGGFTANMVQKAPTHDPIENEAGNGLSNDRYTIAMARTSVVNSATSQFFINAKDNPFLNHKDDTPQGFGYAVFGKVVEGMDVVDAINAVPTGVVNGMNDVPVTTILIRSVHAYPVIVLPIPRD